MNEGVTNLAKEIVLRACIDYKKAVKKLKKKPNDITATKMKRSCERFFNSEWCECLTNIPGETMLKTINLELQEKS